MIDSSVHNIRPFNSIQKGYFTMYFFLEQDMYLDLGGSH